MPRKQPNPPPPLTGIKAHLKMLGHKCKDKITGFSGVVTAVNYDVNGCIQALINPGVDKEGKLRDCHWFDVTRIEITSKDPVIKQPNYVLGYDLQDAGYISSGRKGCDNNKPAF